MKRSLINWRTAAVSVRGFSHEEKDEPCQDAHATVVTDRGWLIAVTADGAGSTRFGGDGARIASQVILECLRAAAPKPGPLGGKLSDAKARALVVKAIEAARRALKDEAKARKSSLAEFHATVVGCLARPEGGGFFFHIGDGAGCAIDPADPGRFVVSRPANGAYAETTFFVTEDEWRENLRFEPFGAEHDLILLMSDGVTPMALKGRADQPEPAMGFISPINKFLVSAPRDDGEAALAATLASERVQDITGDDKTLVWAFRGG